MTGEKSKGIIYVYVFFHLKSNLNC